MECGLTLLHLQPVSIHEFYLFSRPDHFGRVRSIFANLDLDEIIITVQGRGRQSIQGMISQQGKFSMVKIMFMEDFYNDEELAPQTSFLPLMLQCTVLYRNVLKPYELAQSIAGKMCAVDAAILCLHPAYKCSFYFQGNTKIIYRKSDIFIHPLP